MYTIPPIEASNGLVWFPVVPHTTLLILNVHVRFSANERRLVQEASAVIVSVGHLPQSEALM